MKALILAALVFLAVGAPVHGIDLPPEPAQTTRDADMDAARAAIKSSNWKLAIEHLHRAAKRDAPNADAQNLLGFAYRKSGDLDVAFKHYNEALKLDPKHRGAHEYIGEAYLRRGNLAKAEEHLKTLDGLFPCEEYTDLKRAVENDRRERKK